MVRFVFTIIEKKGKKKIWRRKSAEVIGKRGERAGKGLEMDKDRRKIITTIYVIRRNVSKLASNFHGDT